MLIALGGGVYWQSTGARAVPGLVRSLDDPEPSVRIQAAGALAQIGPPAADATPRLLEQARHDANQDARAAAVSALARIDPDVAVTLVPASAHALADADVQVRRTAAVVLGSFGAVARAAVPALVQALGSDDALLRNRAAGALGSIGIPAEVVVPALTRALDDREDIVRHAAAAAFAFNLPGDASAAAEPALRRTLADPRLGIGQLAAIGLANADRMKDDGDVGALLHTLGTASARGYALHKLAQIGPRARGAVPDLARALKDADTLNRYLAAEALGAIGPAARDAAPALTEALRDPAGLVRESARGALARIEAPG